MHVFYDDILSRIAEPPLWFDEHAVPRYADFSPEQAAKISAQEVVLLLIRCQACRRDFRDALSSSEAKPVLAPKIEARTLRFGDPPNVRCCSTGPAMNSISVQVLEYWFKPQIHGRLGPEVGFEAWAAQREFARDPKFERVFSSR
ncbi:hypothetical protein [Celeribacter ethanolicus]|uniref:hypothetical protein n=1 Tax=Celeribacter ethanolicus TaxID=1758178 RepID=UPI000830038E|nr:hypothetical protein [Celeribacter ethanolicus]